MMWPSSLSLFGISSLLFHSEASAAAVRELQDGGTATRSEIVELVPFDVTIGLNSTDGASSIDVFALTDIVEDWLGDSFDANNLGSDYARFTTVILDYQDAIRRYSRQLLLRSLEEDEETSTPTSTTAKSTFVASYQGVTVWTKQGDALVPDDTIVAAIQTQALIQDDGLLEALQAADPSTGLGPFVTNVRASITSPDKENDNGESNNGNSDNQELDIIIIVAIAIAGIAFLLLAFALVMAWRHSRATTQKGHALASPEGTGDESDFEQSGNNSSQQHVHNKRASAAAKAATSPPTEVDASASGLYPESVISEDISTSLTAYYQSGMGGRRSMSSNNGGGVHGSSAAMNASHMLHDAASVSSMESYGYSLDGYTNSIAPTDATRGDDPY